MSQETLAHMNLRVMEGTQAKLPAPHSMALVA